MHETGRQTSCDCRTPLTENRIMNEVETFLDEINWKKWQASHKLFAVLDCAHVQDSIWRTLHSLHASISRPLFEGTPDEGLSSVEPLLLDAVTPSIPRLMPWLIAQEQTSPMVLWLASHHPIDRVQQDLSSLLTVHLPNDPDALLRFYDPRVFNKLAVVLSPEQKAQFFTCADQWWAWNMRSAKRYTITAPQTQGHAAVPLRFSEAQMQEFRQLDVNDFVHDTQVDMVRNKAKYRHATSLSDQALAQQVLEHINKAQNFGFESEQAITTYVQHVASALEWSYQDGGHERIVTVLKDTRLDEDTKLERLQAYCAIL